MRVSEDKLPGQTLPLSMHKLWQVIREQKDLNLPAHKVGRPRVSVSSHTCLLCVVVCGFLKSR